VNVLEEIIVFVVFWEKVCVFEAVKCKVERWPPNSSIFENEPQHTSDNMEEKDELHDNLDNFIVSLGLQITIEVSDHNCDFSNAHNLE
jgi:hypothetical protein